MGKQGKPIDYWLTRTRA